MKRVSVSTLGCKTNQFESAAMIEQLENAGYLIVPFNGHPDIHIINSCTVTARTDSETRRLIRRARRTNPDARIVATGCYAQVAPGDLEKMPELDTVLGNLEKLEIATLLESARNKVSDIGTNHDSAPLKLTTFAEHTRAFLQVQNGCNSFCAYCIVPFARGRSRSVPPRDVLAGADELVRNGYREIVLTGIHLGAYGLDLSPPATLSGLVSLIEAGGIVPRLRIGSVEPNEVDDDLLRLMSNSGRICPHFHLPLQSGSDSILQHMGRHYDAGFFRSLLSRISSLLPDAFVGADLIAGFPGESEAEFLETVSLLEELPVTDLHVFPYSARPGTRAAGLPGQLPPQVIKERSARLRRIAALKKQAFLERFTGRNLDVLVQGYDRNTGLCRGLSRNYITVECPGNRTLINQEISVTITGSDGTVCTGIRS